MKEISKQSTITRNNSDYIANRVGDEIAIMDMSTGEFLGLNAVGATIWDCLEAPATITSIIMYLMNTYDIDEKTCETQTLEYLDKLHTKGLVRIG